MNVVGSVHYPLDCHLSPARFIGALQSQLEKNRVSFRWRSDVLDIEIEQGHRIHALMIAGGNRIEADEVVLCGGVWSPQLARKLALRIPMQAGKGYSLTLTRPRERPHLCSILTEARVAVTPISESLRVGGTMEMTGINEEIRPARVRGIVESFCRYYPRFQPADFEGIEPWSGLRPCSPDGLPYVGRTPRYSNLLIATGHAMMGLSLGPVTGQLAADILTGTKPSHDISLLSPDRYN
jgi:D-amino-acid dehydrogenase